MTSRTSFRRRSSSLSLLALGVIASGLIVAIGLGTTELQASTNDEVVYKECYRDGFGATSPFGRFPACGIDEAATAAKRAEADQRDGFTCLNAAGETVQNRSECAPLDRLAPEAIETLTGRPATLSPEEERQIKRKLDETFAGERLAADREKARAIAARALEVANLLLDSKVFSLRAADRQTLETAVPWLTATEQQLQAELTRDELDATVTALKRRAGDIAALQRHAVRIIVDGPRIENLVTRIDGLVARVGTVLRDVERDGESVPATVQHNYEEAKRLIRDSKGTCSTRRPEKCRHLRAVLELIEAMREPLCQLNSEAVAFCHS